MNKMIGGLLAGIALMGCTSNEALLDDARFATGSRTLTADYDYESLYAVNADEGSITRVDRQTGVTEELDVGAEPTRIARAGNEIFVTLRGERAVAVVRDSASGMSLVDTIPVGAEPYGVVANEAGDTLWVAISMENKVVQIDAGSREVTSEWAVRGRPQWLALHPNGETLFVGSAQGEGELSSIEVGENGNGTVDVVPLPPTERTTVEGVIELTPRIMGDLAIDAFGDYLVIPTLYVDNNSQEDRPAGVDPTQGYYMNPKPGVGRFNSALTQVPLQSNGKAAMESATPIFLAGFVSEDFAVTTMRSYPNSVAISPDGLHYAASMEGSNAVVMVGALDYDSGTRDDWWIDNSGDVKPADHGFVEHPHATITTRPGPSGIVFTDLEEAYVHSWLGMSVSDLLAGEALRKVQDRGRQGLDDSDSFASGFGDVFETAESALPADVRQGRALFYSAVNPDLVATGSGVSCATCHTDGRNDGLTWQLGPDVRQTPSLAGRVSDTHPVTWTQNVETVALEAELTSTVRMGGIELSPTQYADIARFIDHTREVDHPARDGADERLALGEEVFHREEVGCATCHSGEAFTDNEHHDMMGLQGVNTPTLRGIVATAPYMHDGRASTLRTVLELSRDGSMGDTSSLTEAEMDALQTYLESL